MKIYVLYIISFSETYINEMKRKSKQEITIVKQEKLDTIIIIEPSTRHHRGANFELFFYFCYNHDIISLYYIL